MSDLWFLTPSEQAAVQAYDRQCADQNQRDREYAERQLKKSTALADLLDALEKEAMEDIKDATTDIGVLLKCKETFKDRASAENTDVLIWMLRYKIEENHDDITRWRSYKKEPCRV